MPEITAIRPRGSRNRRYDIYVDGELTATVHESVLSTVKLAVGQPFTLELHLAISQADFKAQAWEQALRYLGRREHSSLELKRKLRRKGFASIADQVIAALEEKGYLDDERFTRLFLREKIRLKQWGPQRLRLELRTRGIHPEMIERLLAQELPPNRIRSQAKTLASRKLQNLRRPTFKDRQRLWRFLRGRGFSSDTIREALEEFRFYPD